MKRSLHIYSFIIGLFAAFTIQGCSLQNEIDDLKPDQNLPTIQLVAPTSGEVVIINPIANNVTVSGTTTGVDLTSLSYTLDGTEVVVTSFDGSSPDFSFDIPFADFAEGSTENVSLKLTLKDAAGSEVSETLAFKVKVDAYENPTVTIISPAASSTIIIEPDGKTTIEGTIQSQGASIYTYNIGDGELPLTVTNGEFSQEISLPSILALETKPVTLTVTATDVAMQTGSKSINFTVAKTDPGTTAGNTGLVTFTYAGSSVTYTTVRAKDGNIWLQQNLGSTQVATSATDADSYGDYFQWGRWADGHQKYNSATVVSNTITPNNPLRFINPVSTANPFVLQTPSGVTPLTRWWTGAISDTWTAAKPEEITASNGCDPCKQTMGAGWRLPTKSEWDEIIDQENLTTVNSGSPFSSTLKIPTAGYRYPTSAAYSTGLIFMWTSDSHATASSSGVLLDIRGTVNATTGGSWTRTYGSTVRCIKKQ